MTKITIETAQNGYVAFLPLGPMGQMGSYGPIYVFPDFPALTAWLKENLDVPAEAQGKEEKP